MIQTNNTRHLEAVTEQTSFKSSRKLPMRMVVVNILVLIFLFLAHIQHASGSRKFLTGLIIGTLLARGQGVNSPYPYPMYGSGGGGGGSHSTQPVLIIVPSSGGGGGKGYGGGGVYPMPYGEYGDPYGDSRRRASPLSSSSSASKSASRRQARRLEHAKRVRHLLQPVDRNLDALNYQSAPLRESYARRLLSSSSTSLSPVLSLEPLVPVLPFSGTMHRHHHNFGELAAASASSSLTSAVDLPLQVGAASRGRRPTAKRRTTTLNSPMRYH